MPSPVPVLPAFHVARPRLLDLLDDGAAQPLTAVVGPPGAGKSIVLASWIGERSPSAAWVSCEDRDRDPVVFLGHVASALRASQGDCWLDAVEVLGERDPDTDGAVNTILDQLERRAAVIVLDDVHVAADSRSHLSRLVEHLPSGSRILTGSRGDPPVALHRLRASGRCLEIREADLRLTHEEVDELLQALGAGLSAGATQVLADRADGWVAGVQMAAIALRNESDPERFLAEFSGSVRIVSDYLAEEVLARQTEVVQQFLLRTSVLEELEPGACAAVTGHDDAASILRFLDSSALFVSPTGRDSYRYHQLFRDMLRYQLRANGRDGALLVHRAAAEWYRSQGEFAAAVAQLLAAGDDDRAYALFQAELGRVFLRGGAVAARALVTAIAEGDATIHAGRMVTIATALSMVGALSSADAWLERAERQVGDLDDAGQRRLTVAKAYTSGQRGDAERVLALMDGVVPHPSDDDTVTAAPAFEVLVRGWLHDFRGAREAAARSRSYRPLGVVYDEIMTGGALSWVACVEGSLREAGRLAATALATADELGLRDHSTLSEPLRTHGRLCFERGDLRTAEETLERSMMVVEGWSPARALVSAASLARVWLSTGRIKDAKELSTASRSFLAPRIDSPLAGLLDALDARIALLEGATDEARAITSKMPASLNRSRIEARIELAGQGPDVALDVLQECEPATPRERLDIALLRARCDVELGSARADMSLAAAVDEARRENFAFAVAEELYPCARHLGALLRAAPLDDFAVAVLDLLDHLVPLPEPQPRVALVEPLTERELTVLRYMASRLTTPEIARELYISVNTVRTHTKAVYRKLGVASRRDAVVEAHRLGLL